MTNIFTFLIFQGVPHQNKVYYWVDGQSTKRIASAHEFMDVIQQLDPPLLGEFRKAVLTYSFYLYSVPDHQIQSLPPQTLSTPYRDSVMQIISDEIAKTEKMQSQRNLAAYLAGLGFNEPQTGFEHLKRLFTDDSAT